MKAVLDASALLAYVQNERGAEVVDSVLSEAAISAVNWSEVIQKSIGNDVAVGGMLEDLIALGLAVLPFSAEDAETAARLSVHTKRYGLSLGDRACLGLGLKLGVPVMTTDRAWTKVELPLIVRLVR